MLVDEQHGTYVDTWLRGVLRRPPPELVDALEHGITAVLRVAEVTLGTITLGVILDRVLDAAVERFPILAALRPDGPRLDWNDLHRRAPDLPRDLLADGLHFVMTELLAVLTSLTAGVLTPELHEALAGMEPS